MRRSQNTFYCFSPPVMVATFIIEISLAVYTIWRYKLTAISRLAVLTLAVLATFQLAEFMVCEGATGSALIWSRIGYVAITFLPPLGLHMLYVLVRAKRHWLQWLAYALATGFAGFFLLISDAFSGHACLGNYVIFQVAHSSGGLFGAYYYGLLIAILLSGLYYLHRTSSVSMSRALSALMFGYSIFIIPTVTVSLLNPDTVRGIPSVMCGFAVLLALALVFGMLPATVQAEGTE